MRKHCNGFLRRSRAALAACVAALTLYVCNIYPTSCFGQEDGDWLTIEQVFDFDVPSSVITTGVVDGLENYSIDWAEVVDVYSNFDTSFLSYAVTNTNWWATREWYGNTNVFYHVRTNESPLLSGTMNVAGLSPSAVQLAFEGSNVIAHLQQGDALPWLDVPSFEDYDLSSMELPADNPFESADPLIRGLSPPPGWFLDNLPDGALYQAVFSPWATEINRLASYSFNGVQPFAYLPTAITSSCSNVQRVISDSRVSPRKILALVFSFFNVYLIFRWWIWRLFLIWGIIAGPSHPDDLELGTEKVEKF